MAKFKPIGLSLQKPSKQISRKRGFHDQTLLRHWADFVGADLAALCQPRQIQSGRNGSVLILACLSAHASELSMRAEEIRMRINAALGQDAIIRLKFEHQHIGFDQPKEKIAEPIRPSTPPPNSLLQALEKAENNELREALSTLAKTYYRNANQKGD